MKTLLTWLVLLSLFTAAIALQWLPDHAAVQTGKMTLDKVLLVKSFAQVLAFALLAGAPLWILISTWRVRKAIDKAHEPDYDAVRYWICTGAPLYPAPRYQEIVQLLTQLSSSPGKKPELSHSAFADAFVTRGQGYFLTLEGRSKMLDRVDGGLISFKFMDKWEPRDIGRLVAKTVVAVVAIRFLLVGIQFLWEWLSK